MTMPILTGRTYTLTLPPGLKLINANQRLHHHQRADRTAKLRSTSWETVTEHADLMAALATAKPGPLFQRAHVLGILHPQRAGRVDPANFYPSFKAAVDGLVDAGLLEDDDATRLIGPDMRLGDIVRGGQLELRIAEVAPC